MSTKEEEPSHSELMRLWDEASDAWRYPEPGSDVGASEIAKELAYKNWYRSSIESTKESQKIGCTELDIEALNK